MLQKFLTKVSYFDRFGAEVKLNFRKKETHQSPFGGFCTILLFVVLTVIFIRGAIGLINKETFTISYNKVLNVDPPITELLSKDFMMAFQAENLIENGTKRLFNFIFTSHLQMMDENGNMTKTETSTHKLEQCNISHFNEFDEASTYNKLLKDQLDDYYCLPLNYSLQIQGTQKSNIFQYGKISVTICSSDDCYSTDEIQQFLRLGYFNNSFKINTLMLNRVPNLNIPNNYISYIYSDYYIQAKIGQETKTDVYLEQQQLSIEKSVIPGIKALEEDHVFSILENKLQASSVFTSNITRVASFFIRLSQSETHYYKEYYRFDELFSYVGGITQFLATILGYFILRYNQTGLQIKLANSLYQFDMPEKQKGQMVFSFQLLVNKIFESLKSIEDAVQKFKNSAHRIINLTRLAGGLKFNNQQSYQNDDIDDEMVNHLANQQVPQTDKLKLDKCADHCHESNQTFYLEQDKKKFLSLIVQLILESRKKLSFGVHFLAKQVSGSFKKNTAVNYQSQLFEKSRKMILRDMDILVIMNKLQEIEKIKHVIFNKTQRKVFNYLQKPVVCVKKKINQDKYDQSLIHGDLKNKRDDTLRLTMSSKSLLGIRQKYNTEKKFNKLYEAYEELALAEDPDETEKIMNQRLLKLVEPTIQYSFNSLVEIEKLSRQLRHNKKRRVATQILKPQNFKLGSSNEVEEEIENNFDIESITLNGQKKDNLYKKSQPSLPENKIKNLTTLQSSTRQLKDVKLNQIQSKQDFLDVEINSS
ncbi:unnamed protein product [Paramecium pentaurelia]|uniref:Transmembrane protein n=1 Tax=Paramecium pentaurelia TaxID=43138 RepID=A0A8S1W3B6_9CILI|nr:unnamed protein product [Paramecium pentaurelia]